MGAGGRALRHYAIASVLAHCSLRRLAPIPNAVVLHIFLAIHKAKSMRMLRVYKLILYSNKKRITKLIGI